MAFIGIDLGTTNSLISVWRDGSIELIKNSMSNFMTPSVVGIDDDGTVLVGEIAKQRRISHPDDTVAEFKRKMGTDSTYYLGDKKYSPEELSAILLKKMIKDAEECLGEEISEAIISVPAYFNDCQREATKRAAQIAGIKLKRLVNEPSAAILYERWKARTLYEEGIYLVVDFGGGTLDVSVVECFENIIEIAAVSGDNRLGGKNFDERIAKDFCVKCGLEYDMLRKTEREKILWAAEKTKKALSNKKTVRMSVFLEDIEYAEEYDTDTLLDVSVELLIQVKAVIEDALKGAGINITQITDIVPIGGSCKMPIIQQYLSALIGRDVKVDSENEFYVGYGAGILTGIIDRQQDVRDIVMTDVCPFSLGISSYRESGPGGKKGDFMDVLIPKNSVLPVSRTKTFYGKAEKPHLICLSVYQGEEEYARSNLLLGDLVMTVTPDENGITELEVTFCYDINGILEVTARDVHGRRGVEEVAITRNAGLSPEEIASKRIDSDSFPFFEKNKEENRSVIAWGQRLFAQGRTEHREILSVIIPEFQECVERNEVIEVLRKRQVLIKQLTEMEQSINKNCFDEEELDELLGYFGD